MPSLVNLGGGGCVRKGVQHKMLGWHVRFCHCLLCGCYKPAGAKTSKARAGDFQQL